MAPKRNRSKQTASFEERLAEEAQKCKAAADKKPSGSKSRERLLGRARQMETTSHINKWLSSPGRQPSKALEDFLTDQKK
jgi:hypothetical protein